LHIQELDIVKIPVLSCQLIINCIEMLQESYAYGEKSLSHICFSKFEENLYSLFFKCERVCLKRKM